MQDALTVLGGTGESTGRVELDKIVVEPVHCRTTLPAQETLAVEIDLTDDQAPEMIRADRSLKSALCLAFRQGRSIEDHRDAVVPSIELIARSQMLCREEAKRELVRPAHVDLTGQMPARGIRSPSLGRSVNVFRTHSQTLELKKC
jgi:hypothetical protein